MNPLLEAFVSIKKNKVISIGIVSIITTCMFIMGTISMGILNIVHFSDSLKHQVKIEAFLDSDITNEQLMILKNRVDKITGVNGVQYIDTEEAKERFGKMLQDENILDELSDVDAIPASIVVSVNDPTMISRIASIIKDYDGVENVRYGKEIVENLIIVSNLINALGLVIALALVLATIFIITNTIQLGIYARHQEIEIMKFVGATDFLISVPFVLEGIFLGTISSSFALIGLELFYGIIFEKLSGSLAIIGTIMYSTPNPWLLVTILFGGMFIGGIGSLLSISKYLYNTEK